MCARAVEGAVILVVDNYDSFTYNLVQILLKNKLEVKVIKSDEWTIDDIYKHQQLISAFLLSPGPGHPVEARLCRQILEEFASTHPILGVCLGHQVIAEYFGAHVVRAKKPMHGKVSEIRNNGSGSFVNLPSSLKVVRYHSLIVDDQSLPEHLDVTAKTADGEIMAIRHKHFQIEGWQFHPESILTEHGEQLVLQFFQS
jgi:para-aminobenzoate synthetase component II